LTTVLDAWALVAYLQDEPSAPTVERAIRARDAIVCDVNLGEVLYRVARRDGDVAARHVVRGLRSLVHAEEPDWALTGAAALIKAHHRLSYADAFAVATALRHDAPLYTGDPEIVALPKLLEVVDLRKEASP